MFKVLSFKLKIKLCARIKTLADILVQETEKEFMQEISTYIGFLVAILTLVATIFSLVLYNKQLRRENNLEKERTKQENYKRLEKLEAEKNQQLEKIEILQISMNIISDFLENELAEKLKHYVKVDELKSLDEDLKKYIADRLAVIDKLKSKDSSLKREMVEKTISQAFGIDTLSQEISSSDFEIFFRNRVERRLINERKKTDNAS